MRERKHRRYARRVSIRRVITSSSQRTTDPLFLVM
jgi:hypothetical protein